MDNYKGSIELISGIKQKNNGSFPLVEAGAVQVDETDKRLDEKLKELEAGYSEKFQTAVNTALETAKTSGEFNGYTPEIGDNGHWFINGVDTGKDALGSMIHHVYINDAGILIVEFSDGSKLEAGKVTPDNVTVTPENIESALDNYFVKNPVVTDETDPTVPQWVKDQDHMPTAEEVGARPDTWMPTAAQIGAATEEKVAQVASAAATSHNQKDNAHPDIRKLIENKADKSDIPTVYDWAKEPDKPTYTAADVGADAFGTAENKVTTHNNRNTCHSDIRSKIKALEDGKLDASAVPTVPANISAFNNDAGYIKNTELDSAVENALAEAKASGAFDGKDGYTPIKDKDYFDGENGKSAYQSYRELGGTLTESEWLKSLNGKDGVDGTVQIEPLFAESVEWLKANGDTSKVYILPDNFIYAYFEKESTQAYTNLLPLADTEKRFSGNASDPTIPSSAIKEGYIAGYRVSATNGELKTDTLQNSTGFMPITYGKNIYIKGATESTSASAKIVAFYDSNYNYLGGNSHYETGSYVSVSGDVKRIKTSTFTATNNKSIENCAYFRLGTGNLEGAIIVVADEEPNWNGGSTGGYDWYNTGHAFVPADYEDRINELENRIDNIGVNSTSGTIDTKYLRDWNNGIYDANIPVFETEAVKPDKSNISERTPNNIYALYNDLMLRYPQYITMTDLGLCSDNVHRLYRYDIQAPATYDTSNSYSEEKLKAFLMSGIHNEYIAVYGMFYALEELLSNPDLRPLLRNVHLIVLPCANPYAMVQSNNTIYLNANGVEIHRNFEVGFVDYITYESDGTTVLQYSGTEALTEPESVAIDNIMKTNTDMAFVLSAHSFGSRTDNRVMWCSAGTKYTCNLATRIIGKMSDSWRNRFSEDLADQESYGWVSISGTGGSEYRHAAKYGIQGFNIEVSSDFVASTNAEYKKAYSSFGISRYAEVYANVLLTAFGVYDYKDKDKYCKYIKEAANG